MMKPRPRCNARYTMYVTKEDLAWAAEKNLLSSEQIDPLWEALEKRREDLPNFDFAHVAYYFGALVVMLAMGWLMTLGWEQFGGGGIFVLSLLYAYGFIKLGSMLWHKEGLRVPGGLLYTLAVCMTPLAIYGFQKMVHLWPGEEPPGPYRDYYSWIKGGWFFMELGTIAVSLIALVKVRFPFITLPLSIALWFLSMDIVDLGWGHSPDEWHIRQDVALIFGGIMMGVAFILDRRTDEDFSFWLYLFGLLSFTGGLSLLWDKGEEEKFMVFLIYLFMIILSILIHRQVFIVFGALGVFCYLSYLAYDIFQSSILFPFILSFLGLGIIYLGILYHRHREQITRSILSFLPKTLQRFLPR